MLFEIAVILVFILINGFFSLSEMAIVSSRKAGSHCGDCFLILDRLGHIPHTGESFEFESWSFEIVDMDGNRVDKLLVTKAENETASGADSEPSVRKGK